MHRILSAVGLPSKYPSQEARQRSPINDYLRILWDNKECSTFTHAIQMLSDLHSIENAQAALLDAFETDQYYRSGAGARSGTDHLDAWRRSDANNQILLKHIIAIHGWPKRSTFGDKAELTAFLIAQHADTEFMQHAFTLRSALPQEELSPGTQPLMEDRLRLRAGQPQKYGTQFFKSPDGTLKLDPIEGIDVEKLLAGDRLRAALLNSRRTQVGLLPIEDYLKHFGIVVEQASGTCLSQG